MTRRIATVRKMFLASFSRRADEREREKTKKKRLEHVKLIATLERSLADYSRAVVLRMTGGDFFEISLKSFLRERERDHPIDLHANRISFEINH